MSRDYPVQPGLYKPVVNLTYLISKRYKSVRDTGTPPTTLNYTLLTSVT